MISFTSDSITLSRVSSFPNVDNHSNYVKDVSAHAGDSYQIARAMVNIYPNLSATTAFHLQRRFA
jgi:hypothetical protein